MRQKALVLAHRGWSAKYPENTRRALREALVYGIDGLEFDVQMSADGVPVIIHDPTVDRTTDGTGAVAALPYAELARLNAAARWPTLPAEPIPTLRQVLDDAFRIRPDGLYNIEIKVYNGDWRELVDRAVRIVMSHPLGPRVLFSSFHHPALEYVKSRYPATQIGLLYEQDVAQPWYAARQLAAYSVHLHHQFVHADVVAGCRRYGVKVAAWPVDQRADLKRMFQHGADIVISGCVDAAKDVRDAM